MKLGLDPLSGLPASGTYYITVRPCTIVAVHMRHITEQSLQTHTGLIVHPHGSCLKDGPRFSQVTARQTP